jgi:hypothetical protein
MIDQQMVSIQTTELVMSALYLMVSVGMTVAVARTLHTHGRVFLLDAFGQDASMADAVNGLLRVGFYLVNLGFVLLFLNAMRPTDDLPEALKLTATNIGVVMLVLGGMHFFNMRNIAAMRARARTNASRQPGGAGQEIR